MVSRRLMTFLRWTGRDLRRHWLAVTVVAAVIAIGTGVFAGLGSTGTWRRSANDASFAELQMHDLRLALSPGTFAAEGELVDIVSRIPSADAIQAASERLFVNTQVDASTADETILVGGRVVGLQLDSAPDRLWVDRGNEPDGTAAVIETKFANTFDLPITGSVELSGGERLPYRGTGSLPTDFYVSGATGDLLAQFNYAILYTTLDQAQRIADRPDAVNDLVVTLAADADRDAVQIEIEQELISNGKISATVTNQDEDEAFRILYTDIDNDQRVWTVLSGIILASAALAAFNLVSRLVESQRREIGVGMAIGAPARLLAVRPMLIGLEIAIIGVGLGVAFGWLVSSAMRSLLLDLLPMPVWKTPFQFGKFAQAAALGVAVPLISSAIPVWRAVSVEPIQAIRTGHLAAKRPPRILRRVRMPGSSLNQMPLRNVLRTPRRTALTVFGVAAAIAALVAVMGMLNSFESTVQVATDETALDHPDRLTVSLDGFYPIDHPSTGQIVDLEGVAQVDSGVQLPATAGYDGVEIDLLIESIDFATAAWRPTAIQGGVVADEPGLILAADAAADLGVHVGDVVTITHPVRSGLSFSMEPEPMTVAAIHPNPLRVFAYVTAPTAAAWGFDGITNVAQVIPEAGGDRDGLQRDLFEAQGVGSAQPVTRLEEVFEDAIDQFTGFLVVTQAAVLALAALIAFNSARITVEERTREHATMLAFGTPVRSVLGTMMKEGILVGTLATLVGIAGGYLTLSWFVSALFSDTLPELGVTATISASTFIAAAGIGVLAVTLTPVLMVRRLRKMNLPSTLRVVE